MPSLYRLGDWEHPATFDTPRAPDDPRRIVAVMTLGSWDFGIFSAAPGGYRFLDIYLGRWGWQIDTEPQNDEEPEPERECPICPHPRSSHSPLGCTVLFCGCEHARILFDEPA